MRRSIMIGYITDLMDPCRHKCIQCERCHDLLFSHTKGEEKHRHCGAIMTGVKNITSTSNTLQLQFHSDGNNNVTQTFQYFSRVLKGFWLFFTRKYYSLSINVIYGNTLKCARHGLRYIIRSNNPNVLCTNKHAN